ncbi:PWI domain-containing protein [Aspergillus affinis]|uniref:PWI domain-containing protein n=1 Tax=Aspergillus affinis TaxID=1070780 RepID=UPI0022FF3BC8|nr:uncharacterized protein KD926_008026 [Aspergillus affinis]KAI9045610.1 hypothetical protein KD926_008026 [Aspergillus affinis]
MQVAEILSDLTSLRVCDHHDALALVTVNDRISASRLPSENLPSGKSKDDDPTDSADDDLRRAKELVELHYEIKARHVDGRVDGELVQARERVDRKRSHQPKQARLKPSRTPGRTVPPMSDAVRRGIPANRAASSGAINQSEEFPNPVQRSVVLLLPPPLTPGSSRVTLLPENYKYLPSGWQGKHTMATTVDAKLLKKTKFPPEFSRKVDMTKVNIEVMKKWIAGKISDILGNEDDVVIELCFNLLEGSRYPDIKSLQIQLTGFLDKDTAKFCKELWSLCLSAQENPQGVPKELLEAKKLELIQEKIEAEKAAEEARRQKEQERTREREMEQLRRRERNDRNRVGRRGGARGGRDFDRRRSPPRRHSRERFREPPARREFDSYVPSGPRRGRYPSRSPSRSRSRSRSVSSSRSPPPRRQRHASRDKGDRDRHRNRDKPRRRRSVSNSVSPDRADRHKRPRRRSPVYGDRARSNSHSDSSRSRSPRRDDRRRPRSVSSHSSSRSRSRSPPESEKGAARRRRSSPYSSRADKRESPADIAKARKSRDHRRLSRSRERDDHRRRRYSRSVSRSRSRSRGRSRTASSSPRRGGGDSRSRTRSRSRSRGPRDRKRRRSLQRYAPAARRRRNTSSVSVRSDKRQRMTDQEEPSARGSSSPPPPEKSSSADQKPKDTEENRTTTTRARISSTELREKLLREKLVAMRRNTSTDQVGSHSQSSK